MSKEINMWYVHVPTPHEECKPYVLYTCTKNNDSKIDSIKKIRTLIGVTFNQRQKAEIFDAVLFFQSLFKKAKMKCGETLTLQIESGPRKQNMTGNKDQKYYIYKSQHGRLQRVTIPNIILKQEKKISVTQKYFKDSACFSNREK